MVGKPVTCCIVGGKSAKENLLIDSIHVEATKSISDAIRYCTKDATRLEGPFQFGKLPRSDPLKKGL